MLLIVFATAYFLLRTHTFFGALVHDDGLFLYTGQAWADGQVPYQDFWDHKPPGLFFYLSLPLRLFPFNLFAVKAFCVLMMAVTATMLAITLSRVFGRIGAAVAMPCFVLFTSVFETIRSGGLTEESALLWIALAFYTVVTSLPNRWRAPLIAGIFFGLAVQFRQTFALTALFGFVWYLQAGWTGRWQWRASGFAIALLAAGMLIPELVISAYFALQGAWWAYIEASYLFNLIYVEAGGPEISWAEWLELHQKVLLGSGPLLAFPFLSLLTIPLVAAQRRRYYFPLWAAFLGDWAAVSLSGEYYSHYFVQSGVTCAWLGALAFEAIWNALRQLPRSQWPIYKHLFFVLSLAGALASLYPLSTAAIQARLNTIARWNDHLSEEGDTAFQRGVGRAVQQLTKPDQTVLLIGRVPNSVYFFSDRYAGSRYYHYSPLWKQKLSSALQPHHRKHFLEDLKQRRPALLLFDLTRLRDEPISRVENNTPNALPYIREHYLPFHEMVDEIQEAWFWYDIRLVIWVRSDLSSQIAASADEIR